VQSFFGSFLIADEELQSFRQNARSCATAKRQLRTFVVYVFLRTTAVNLDQQYTAAWRKKFLVIFNIE
jgi:hypothetical protein